MKEVYFMNYNINEIINDLKNAENILNDNFSCEDNDYFCDNLTQNVNDKYIFDNGISKLVLIPDDKNKDYVIKIPYNGCYENSYNEESHFYEAQFCEFYGGESSERMWDYCANEQIRYSVAKENNLNQYFAETKIIGFIGTRPIYIQERCNVFSRSVHKKYSLEEHKKTYSVCGDICCINPDWLTSFLYVYGEEETKKFTDFVHKLDWDDDLRADNLGLKNGKPIVIDYSGFWE